MEKLLIVIFSLLLVSIDAQAQYQLAGKVTIEEGKSLAYGDLVLLQSSDSALVAQTMISEGDFLLMDVAAGEYIVRVNALGYEDYFEQLRIEADQQLSIQLTPQSLLLNGVTVTAARNTIVNKNGNLKLTIDNSIFANQPTTLDVLSMLPGVQLSGDRQSLSIIGKGSPLIYLEYQRISLADLNAIPVQSIKSIEVINNPSARYEANGRAVVLVTRKLNFSDGIRMDLSEVMAWRQRFSSYATFNADLKKNKLELKTNFGYNQIGTWESIRNLLAIPTREVLLEQASVSTGPRPQFVIGGGAYYELSEDDYLSVNANLRTHTTHAPITTSSTLKQAALTDRIASFVDGYENRHFFTSNLNYNKRWKPIKSNLFMGIQYSNYLRDLENSISNDYNEMGMELSQMRYQKYTIDVWAGRMDFEKTFETGQKWEIGLNYYQASADAFLDFQFLDPAEERQSNYDYEERNYAAYTQLSGELSWLDYSFGLRSETATVKGGFQEETDLLIDRKQTVLFPRATLNFTLDSLSGLSLNYAKSIRRPNYSNASSISTFIHPFLEFTRNANLQPTITNEWSLNLQHRNQSLNFSYYERKNPVFFSVDYDEVVDRIIMSPQNFQQERGLNIQLTSPITHQLWTMTNLLLFSINEVKDERAVIGGTKPYLYYYSNHQFRLPKDWTLGAFVWGLTARQEGIFERNAYAIVGGSINKTINGKLHLGLSFDDIFRRMVLRENYTINQIDAESAYIIDRRSITLSLRYSFGKISKSTYKNREVDEHLNRIR